jgi:hypothetical protein
MLELSGGVLADVKRKTLLSPIPYTYGVSADFIEGHFEAKWSDQARKGNGRITASPFMLVSVFC